MKEIFNTFVTTEAEGPDTEPPALRPEAFAMPQEFPNSNPSTLPRSPGTRRRASWHERLGLSTQLGRSRSDHSDHFITGNGDVPNNSEE